MYLLAIFLPCLISFFVLIFGKYIGKIGVSFLTVNGILMSLLLSIFIFNEIVINNSSLILTVFTWVDLSYFIVDVSFFFDTLTSVMLLVVCFISLLVHIYSIDYMGHDKNFHRYMSYLSLFTFFMLLLVTADNYLLMFIGWEGVGLSSYLLINFWYFRILANKAAIKAMLVNRVGDLALLVGLSIIFFNFLSLKYAVIFNLVCYLVNQDFVFFNYSFHLIDIICLFLFLGAMGKSAQLGLHIWLPDAMEGPTPVSALIHAATMVTAGVFLVIRSSFLFEHSANMLIFVSFIGGLTCLFSALIGAFQFDIKKIVAYSTCSQLGYMFFSAGLSNYSVSLFHLFNHAFFKALLFLSMGSIIHALLDEQDIRRMGGLLKYLPLTYVMVFIGSLSLLALPFLTGFYSKDMLLEFILSVYTINSFFIYWLGVTAAFFTAFYSIRLLYWVFLSKPNFYRSYFFYISELNIFMLFSMTVLSFCSIFVGYCFSEAFNGIGSLFWGNSVYISILNYSLLDAEFSLFFYKYVPLIITLFGVGFFFIFNNYLFDYSFFLLLTSKLIYNVYYFFNKSLFFDYLTNNLFVNCILNYSYFNVYKYLEKGVFELYGPIFILDKLADFYEYLRYLNSGLIYFYVFLILWSMLLLILLFEFIALFSYGFMLVSFFVMIFVIANRKAIILSNI